MVPQTSPAGFNQAVAALRSGGVVAYPTEAVFGIGCDPSSEPALRRILAMKERPASKGLILIASDRQQLAPYLGPVPAEILARMTATWPGPVTWLVPALPQVSRLLRGEHDGLAVRVTAHPVAVRLCREAGTAIVSTSANPGGQPPARSLSEVRTYFGDQLDCCLDGPVNEKTSPTEIRDARTGRIVRPASPGVPDVTQP